MKEFFFFFETQLKDMCLCVQYFSTEALNAEQVGRCRDEGWRKKAADVMLRESVCGAIYF